MKSKRLFKGKKKLEGKTNALVKAMKLRTAVKAEFSYDYTLTPVRMTVKVFYPDSEKTFILRVPEPDTAWVKWIIEKEIKEIKDT